MALGRFSDRVDTFVHFYTPDIDLMRHAWGSRKDEIRHGSCTLIHAPSYWDDYRPEHKPGEDAFYEALSEAYEKHGTMHVFFVYWPESI